MTAFEMWWMKRIITFDLEYPRYEYTYGVHDTRLFSQNTVSSRAIPRKKVIELVKNTPVMPIFIGEEPSRYASKEELTGLCLEIYKL